jgi:hypothetical protein
MAVESPPVVDYTTGTKRAIRVARRVIFLRTYFEHLWFVDHPISNKHLIHHWWRILLMQTTAIIRSTTNWSVSSLLVVVHSWIFFNSFCTGIILGPVYVETSVPVLERGKQHMRTIRVGRKSRNDCTERGTTEGHRSQAIIQQSIPIHKI